MLIRRADLQPMNLPLRWGVVQRLFARGDLDRGWAQLRRAKALLTPEFAAKHPEYRTQIQQLEVTYAWLHHDVHRVRELADALARSVAGTDLKIWANVSVALDLVGIYNSLGRTRDARRIADGLPPDSREENVVRVDVHGTKGGKPGAKEALQAYLTGISADLGNLPPTPALRRLARADWTSRCASHGGGPVQKGSIGALQRKANRVVPRDGRSEAGAGRGSNRRRRAAVRGDARAWRTSPDDRR